MPKRLAAIPALLLVVLAVWEIVATRRHAAAVPGDPAWARAARLVRAGYLRGDLIVFAPAWADPIGRLHLGDLIPIEAAARMDAARYARIWELAIRDAVAPDVVGLVPVEQHEVDGVVVRRYERAPVTVVADLRALLPAARVEGGRATVELAEVAFEPHRCVLVATPADRPATVTFRDVPLGTELVGYVGIADVFTRRESREPAELSVAIAGKQVAAATAPVDRWVRWSAPTTPHTADVQITLRWTPHEPGLPAKQICFAAEARR